MSASNLNDLANIVLLTVDCLRFDRVADSPYSKKFTKNINSLANKGVLFHETVTNSSWTIPSLITSQSLSLSRRDY